MGHIIASEKSIKHKWGWSISKTTIIDMDPVNNFIKGYNKLNHLEDQAASSPSSLSRKKPLVIAISFVLLFTLTLVIGAVIGALAHYYYTQSPEPPTLSSTSSNAADSIKTICNVTQYPVSCFSAFSTLNASQKLDPELIFKVSLKISLSHLSNLSSLPKTLIVRLRGGKDPSSEAALRDCESLLGDAAAQVNNTMSEMLTDSKVEDMRTWLSSAITDLETCLDGLEEVDSSVVDEVKNAMQPSKEFTSNSLAILSNIKVLLRYFNLSMP